VFYIDVAKIDRGVAKVHRDIAHVAVTKYACCKPMFRCFRRMLQMFHLDVSKLDLGVGCCTHVAMPIHTCCKCFIYFGRMLQIFHLDVLKIDLVLHILLWLYMYVSNVSSVLDIYFGRML
jgi:hypothetical protein